MVERWTALYLIDHNTRDSLTEGIVNGNAVHAQKENHSLKTTVG